MGAPASRRLRWLRRIALAIAVLVVALLSSGYFFLRASLPQLDGELADAAVRQSISIERDAAGVPTLSASSRVDLAFATGFAHAQDRFFQMDLMRRAAAGELAELLGARLIEADRHIRIHRFRSLAAQVIEQLPSDHREVLDAYVAGVNFEMHRWQVKPWEYSVLRSPPREWTAADSLLVAFSMYLDLNDWVGKRERERGELREALPPELFSFIFPFGSEWDAPITGGTWRTPAMPSAEVIDLRSAAAKLTARAAPRLRSANEEPAIVGSNSWAVAGSHTATGAALLANDMHLGLRLPHIWYRARLRVVAPEDARDLIGVTLPGLPLLIAGSNGHVAWGHTNSYGDWTDLVIVEDAPDAANRYLTAEGSDAYDVYSERINVRDGEAITLTVKTTRWGPIVQQDSQGHSVALAWTAHHPEATNLRMLDFEAATNVEELLSAANRAGGPVQNVVAADSLGHIGWSLMGQVPIRAAYDSTVPHFGRAANTGWLGWRKPEEYPRVVDPAAGRVWTANTRTIDAQRWLGFLGDGGQDLGARASQIRDGLLGLQAATAQDMVAIQVDDRALFLIRWHDLLVDLLSDAAVQDRPQRSEAKRLIEHWSARAAPADAGYRLVRAFRLQVREQVFASLIAPARLKYPGRPYAPSSQFEAPLWQLVTQRPIHLLDARYSTWDEALLSALDDALTDLTADCGRLSDCTWGQQNTLKMRHPLSVALPFASQWLDMPAEQMAGDSAMPRVQATAFGASERLVVSPGHEAEGLFQMPGGQVDHPLSPFYGAGHAEWVQGKATPLLPGAVRHTLRLSPAE